jgi:diguanylate cyclase (GGDEF)-like protein
MFRPFYQSFRQVAILLSICLLSTQQSTAQEVIQLVGNENGKLTTGNLVVWLDESAEKNLEDVISVYSADEFLAFDSNKSTGLIKGTLWSHFYLKNATDQTISLHIEYVDHQLITLDAFEKSSMPNDSFHQIAGISLTRPFSERKFAHNRFVFETRLESGQTSEYFVKYSSDGSGYIFPNLRIWEPNNLRLVQTKEITGIAFLIGGFFLMSIIACVAGIATREKFFFAYAVYAIAKIGAWSTIYGYTHQLVLVNNFHWSYISISAAFTIFCGLFFSRLFLQSAKFTPKFDYIILFMMANAIFLLVSALFELKALAIISITIALLLYPMVLIVAIKRWWQGSKAAAIFAMAWSFLAAGLVLQAMRDLGFIEHNLLNYYWPPFASYTEMIVIMVAMGLKVRLLRHQKLSAERKYNIELEQSKARLEVLVKKRTLDLEQEKLKAELEAQTDSLTGTRNRRYFFTESKKLISSSKIHSTKLSLLMFDIDNFKNINDTYGHAIGDEALKTFSRVIGASVRETDIFARLGGEEFSLVLVGDKEHAKQMAERLRTDIGNIKIETPKGQLQFTTSIGLAHLGNENIIDELMVQADTALYEAKSKGRNQVVEHC